MPPPTAQADHRDGETPLRVKVDPHLFRHIAAKLDLEAQPGAYGVVRLLLAAIGHAAAKYYCGTETAAALKHFDAFILSLRERRPALGRTTDDRRGGPGQRTRLFVHALQPGQEARAPRPALADWPAPDRPGWRALLIPAIRSTRWRRRAWAPASRRLVQRRLRSMVAWLQRTGRLVADARPPPAWCRRRWRTTSPISCPCRRPDRLTYVDAVACFCRAAAPDADWRWLTRLVGRLKRRVVPAPQGRRMVPTPGLMALGQPSCAPPRRAGPRRRGEGRFWDVLPSRRPGAGTGPLSVDHRPLLCARAALRSAAKGSPAVRQLWVSREGSAMIDRSVYESVVRLTLPAFGRTVNPHLFRDCAATSVATDDPEHVHITTSILGHTSLATSERDHNHAQSIQAARRYQELVLGLRDQHDEDRPKEPRAGRP